jgi:hypothetical protein
MHNDHPFTHPLCLAPLEALPFVPGAVAESWLGRKR